MRVFIAQENVSAECVKCYMCAVIDDYKQKAGLSAKELVKALKEANC